MIGRHNGSLQKLHIDERNMKLFPARSLVSQKHGRLMRLILSMPDAVG